MSTKNIIKKIFRPAYHSYLGIRHYRRALRILNNYKKHYKEAQSVYINSGELPDLSISSLDQILMRKWEPHEQSKGIQFPANYFELINNIHQDIQKKFIKSKNCRFFPPIDNSLLPEKTEDIGAIQNNKVIALQLKNCLDIHCAEELCQAILPQIEKRFFGSHLIVDKVYAYRNLPSYVEDQVSWKWHYDNHPVEIMKIMIYLTDVGEGNGPLECLVTSNGRVPRYMPPKPLLGVNITPRKLKKYKEEGFVPQKVTGPQGTIIFFDENILHKANQAKKNFRDVIVFQIRPATFRPERYIDPQWSGSFEHADFNINPWDYHPRPKKKTLSY